MTKIEQLKQILESQELSDGEWTTIKPEIRTYSGGDMSLQCRALEIGFSFDNTGEKLLGIVNWK